MLIYRICASIKYAIYHIIILLMAYLLSATISRSQDGKSTPEDFQEVIVSNKSNETIDNLL